MKKKTPKISESEWKIMKVLWRESPQPAYDIASEISKIEDWDIRTIKTFLSRLVKKGAISYQKYKNLYLYFPVISEEDTKEEEGETFLNQVFDGSVKEMFVHFANSKNLDMDGDQLEKLRKLVDEMEE